MSRKSKTHDVSQWLPRDILEPRFWSKVNKTPTCWLWRSGTAIGDTRAFMVNYVDGVCLNEKISRVAYRWMIGEIPTGSGIKLACGDHRCVNPAHMKLESVEERAEYAVRGQERPSRERDVRRFMTKIRKQDDGCWRWIASFFNEYGSFYLDGKTTSAHRASFILFNGQIGDGLVVRHTCDHPWCVAPKHLVLGTYEQNSRDMIARGRNHLTSKLTVEDVAELKGRYVKRDGECERLAEAYGLSRSGVQAIVSGKNWPDVKPSYGPDGLVIEPIVTKRPRGEGHHNTKITEAEVRELRQLRESGHSCSTLAKRYGLSIGTVSAIATRRTWRHVD